MNLIKRSWVEIDIDQLVKNYLCYKNYIGNKEIMAVVKADGYGHGAVEVAKSLQRIGVCNFAVSNISEAIELRQNDISGQILILGFTPIEEIDNLLKYDITQALLSGEYTKEVIQSGAPIKCQYAIDTGMNRIGLDADKISSCESEIRAAADKLNLTGLFTHLCVADALDEGEFTKDQIRKFGAIVDSVKDLELPYIHCLNSAGGLWHQTDISCFVRLGIILYGLKPDYLNELPKGIEPVLEWKSVISMVKTVHAGATIGYGRTFKAEIDMKIATIPTGYADGYNRMLSNKGYVLINGKKAPIVGRVCMDQFMVDVTEVDCKPYDEVVLIGKSEDEIFSADDMAQVIGTIGYEIVCGISKRVQRLYKEK